MIRGGVVQNIGSYCLSQSKSNESDLAFANDYLVMYNCPTVSKWPHQ